MRLMVKLRDYPGCDERAFRCRPTLRSLVFADIARVRAESQYLSKQEVPQCTVPDTCLTVLREEYTLERQLHLRTGRQ